MRATACAAVATVSNLNRIFSDSESSRQSRSKSLSSRQTFSSPVLRFNSRHCQTCPSFPFSIPSLATHGRSSTACPPHFRLVLGQQKDSKRSRFRWPRRAPATRSHPNRFYFGQDGHGHQHIIRSPRSNRNTTPYRSAARWRCRIDIILPNTFRSPYSCANCRPRSATGSTRSHPTAVRIADLRSCLASTTRRTGLALRTPGLHKILSVPVLY